MINQSWLVIISVGFLMIVLIFLAAIGFLIYALIELKKIGANLKEFLKITEERMLPLLNEAEKTLRDIRPTINEAELTLRSIRKVSDDMGRITESAKTFSDAATDIVVNLRVMSMLIRDLREGLIIRTSGIMAGLKEAYEVLTKQLKERR